MHRRWLSLTVLAALASLTAAGSQAAVLQNFTPDSPSLAAAPVGGSQLAAGKSLPIILVVPDRTAAVSAVPEPAGWAMMLVGFGGLGALLRRRRAVAA